METKKSILFELDNFENRISHVIKVIGVGGAGCNAVNYMFTEKNLDLVDFIVANTDVQALNESPVPLKVQLGKNLTGGLGAGSKPEIGKKAALEDLEEVKSMLEGKTKMLFITAGMGGGTGTGAAPEIARLAKSLGILTVGVVTMPFEYEGEKRRKIALKGIDLMRKYVDSLLIVNNQKLIHVYGDLDYVSAFKKSDEVLSNAVESVTRVIMKNFQINVDFNDVKAVLEKSGTALIGTARASGENRAKAVIKNALTSPLLNDNKIKGAKDVLLLIVSGTKPATVKEIDYINKYVRQQADNEVNIIMGLGIDETLGENLSVTVIATGFPPETEKEIIAREKLPERVTVLTDEKAEDGPVKMELDLDDNADAVFEEDNFPDVDMTENNREEKPDENNDDSFQELSLFDEEPFKIDKEPSLKEKSNMPETGARTTVVKMDEKTETGGDMHMQQDLFAGNETGPQKNILILDDDSFESQDMHVARMSAMEEKHEENENTGFSVDTLKTEMPEKPDTELNHESIHQTDFEALRKYIYKFKKVDVRFPSADNSNKPREILIQNYVVLKNGDMKLMDGNSYLNPKFD